MLQFNDMPPAIKGTPLGDRMEGRTGYLAANENTIQRLYRLSPDNFTPINGTRIPDPKFYGGLEFIAHMGAMSTLTAWVKEKGVSNDCDRAIVNSAQALKRNMDGLDPETRAKLQKVLDFVESDYLSKKPSRVVGHQVPDAAPAMEMA
jgi:hypothetical protein